MIISWAWLGRYVDLENLDAEKSALKFTMATAEIEKVYPPPSQEFLQQFEIAQIESVEKHPKADKLSLCKVKSSTGILDIVCGASNVRPGLKVILAPLGAKVGDMEIVKAKIRGEESFGMLCSMKELELGEDNEGIAEMDSCELGQKLDKVFDSLEATWDLDNKSITHRPDLWGHYGLARELAGICRKSLSELQLDPLEGAKGSDGFSVKIDVPDLCRRYCGLSLSGIRIGPSPDWLQTLLLQVGQKPINNVVDATNFVMLELGQPNHAFDSRQLSDRSIQVTTAKEGTPFKSLTGAEINLSDQDIVIVSGDKAVALAGVVGGDNSSISDDTTDIFLEAAHFDALRVRQSASRHDLRTDSSARFEKSLDPANAEMAIRRMVTLLRETCPDLKLNSELIDIYPAPIPPRSIEISGQDIRERLGADIPDEEQKDILTRLGFKLREKGSAWVVDVPSYRNTKDIQEGIDLVEEVGRMYGYDNITPVEPKQDIRLTEIPERLQKRRDLCDSLAHHGYDEIKTYSFIHQEALEGIGFSADKILELKNPMNREQTHLRPTLLHHGLQAWKLNSKHMDHFQCFELGVVFFPRKDGELPEEKEELLMARYSKDDSGESLYQLKADLLRVLEALGADDIKVRPQSSPPSFIHPARSAGLWQDGREVGLIGELHPSMAHSWGFRHRISLAIVYAPLDLKFHVSQKYLALNPYPAVSFSLSLLVPERKTSGEVMDLIKSVDSDVIEDLKWEGNFSGEVIGEGLVSMTFSMSFRRTDRTLVKGELADLQKRIVDASAAKGYHLRTL